MNSVEGKEKTRKIVREGMEYRENWSNFKARKLKKYRTALAKEEVDRDIIPLLDLINSKECLVTLSSCSGRIAVLDTPKFGDKLNSKFLGKWHTIVKTQKVIEAVNLSEETCWLITYPPIIHIACKSFEMAEKMMKVTNDNRFKSCMISTKGVIEINTHDRMEMLIAVKGEKLVNEKNLEKIVEISNQKLSKSKRKLEKLKKIMKEF